MMTVGSLMALLSEFNPRDEVLIDCGIGECPVDENGVDNHGYGVVIHAEKFKRIVQHGMVYYAETEEA